MSAVITPADRAAAHALFQRVSGRECMSNTDVHGVSCNDVVQAIADAREAENKACEREVALMVTKAGAAGEVSQAIALGESRLAIAARRSK